jgi:capsular exopolysaccharide synthesis family protein
MECPEGSGAAGVDPVDVRAQLNIARGWLPLLIISVVLAGAAAFLLSGLEPRVYEAKATLIVGESLSGGTPDINQLDVSQRLSATYATVATTRPLLEKVVTKLNLASTADELAVNVFASAAQDAALLTITARAGDPAAAAAIANAVAEELIAASPAVRGQQSDVLQSVDEDLAAIRVDLKSTQSQIDLLLAVGERTPQQDATVETLQGRLVSLRSTYATLLAFSNVDASNRLAVVQPAVAPDSPIAPRPLLNATLAATLAFLVVSVIAFLVEYLDDAIKDPDEVREALGLPTLGSIERMRGGNDRPEMYRLVTILYPRSPAAEAYRTLRTNVDFASVDTPVQTVLVASAVPSEGKTVTAANLAVAMAQTGRRVLLIDADLRKPGIHAIFNLPNGLGLTDLIRSDTIRVQSVIRSTEQPNLHLLCAGTIPPNPAEFLGSQRMRALLPTLTENHDIVIFDSPPIEAFADAAVLSSFLDGTLLVVRSRRGHRVKVRRACEALARADAHVIGVVLNGLSRKGKSDYATYYGTSSETPTPAPAGAGSAAIRVNVEPNASQADATPRQAHEAGFTLAPRPDAPGPSLTPRTGAAGSGGSTHSKAKPS